MSHILTFLIGTEHFNPLFFSFDAQGKPVDVALPEGLDFRGIEAAWPARGMDPSVITYRTQHLAVPNQKH